MRSNTVVPREFPLNFVFVLLGAAFLVAYFLYAPAFNGPFVFDDSGLPFYTWNRERPASAWVSGVRPGLMFSYWLNRYFWGDTPGAYHVVNLFIHIGNTGLVFLVLWRFLGCRNWDIRRRKVGAALGALLFLIHPLQTESVSYIDSRPFGKPLDALRPCRLQPVPLPAEAGHLVARSNWRTFAFRSPHPH